MLRKEFIKLPLTDIHPYPNNPRINDEAVAYVVESMNQTGNLDPIEVDENNVILSGHTRLMALQELGVSETDCVRYTGLTEEQKRKYRILANKTAEVASWDEELLQMEIGDLDFGDFDFGFELSDGGVAREQKGSMKEKYLVPPFSVIYANKPDWLSRKRAWVAKGLHSEIGRGGQLTYNTRSSNPSGNFEGGVRTKQSVQEQQPIKQLHDRSQALATNTIARMKQMKQQRKRAVHGNAI